MMMYKYSLTARWVLMYAQKAKRENLCYAKIA